MKITGIVFSGLKEASVYMQMPEYKEKFNSALGFVPFEGTLNLKISDEDTLQVAKLEPITIEGFSIEEKKFGAVTCHKIVVAGKKCAIIVAENSRYKKYNISAIEIAAPVSMREYLNVKDGDSVEVELPGI
ncbi:MAG: CTP-dependent riboflavin kinase [Candidatus Woesearchaeota archaeon]|nr:CTP-dependent riboflavin kinase [Candidatus Woesearchaeota archaeon]